LVSCRRKAIDTISPLPKQTLSENNPIAFGKKLFFDKRLSINNSVSCATCHNPNYAFSDRLIKSRGVYGREVQRNAPTILNVDYSPAFMFDAHIKSLEEQAIVPIQEHTEMGIEMRTLIRKLRRIPLYNKLAYQLYNRSFDAYVLTRSIAAFERSLYSINSRFDQFYYRGNQHVLTTDEKIGWKLFSEKLHCIKCHAPPLFTNYQAINNGVYKNGEEDKGRFRIYGDSSDIGKFKVPSLRNVELTYPYMHNGSLQTLAAVIDHYSNGGRDSRNKSTLLEPFKLSLKDKNRLIKFLKTLTDTSYSSLL
jgi:cytochrome c peroxidase